ncbi:hypothetical protein FRC03_002645 [Tulasnella sp. 419]|nr:hypothetical protein FRC03_002645 [Tulasnella sp. 419]
MSATAQTRVQFNPKADPDHGSLSSSISGTSTPVSLEDDTEQQLLKPTPKTPLPKLQLAIICISRLAEPIAYTQIFPYINQMVEELHVTDKPSEIGFYSGLVDSLFAIAQLFTIYQWGRLSDRIGRKPVLLMGLTGVALASTCFGLSNSFIGMLVSRCMAGALSGNAVVVLSILGEITDETNQAQAFSLTGVIWSVGSIIGSTIGGLLSHPAERYPTIFGEIGILKSRPYFLPCFVSASITASSVLFALIFLEESLPSKVEEKRRQKALSIDSGASTPTLTSARSTIKGYGSIPTSLDEPAPPEPAPAPSLTSLIRDYNVRAVLISTFLLNFICGSYDVVFTLFSYTPVSLGGLSRTPSEIGIALAFMGIFGIFLSLFVFHYLHDRFGVLRLYKALMSLFPLCFMFMPVLSQIARFCTSRSTSSTSSLFDGILWAAILFDMILTRVGGMSYSCNMILTKRCAPSAESLGATFGLAQSVSSIARATAPAFVSSLFAISIEKQILGGNLVWLVMVIIAYFGVVTVKGHRI